MQVSDIAKWALLIAGAIALIALIVALPFVQYIDLGQFGSLINDIVEVVGNAFQNARGLLNNFLTPFGRGLATGILVYLIGKWAITIGIKITAWIYHFIFK